MQVTIKSQITKWLPWAITFILAVISIAITYYFGIREKHPGITFEIISEYNVLDVHKPLRNLSIFYRGENIQANKLNLRIYTINIKNEGELHIKSTDFEPKIPWGLSVSKGRFVEQPRLIDPSAEYIKKDLNPKTISDTQIEFDKIPFDKGDNFKIELLVLHQIDVKPKFDTSGKVPGLNKPRLVYNVISEKEKSAWEVAFQGTAVIQLVRMGAYLVGFIILVIAVMGSIIGISSVVDNKKSKKQEEELNSYLKPILDGKSAEEQKQIKFLLNYSSDAKKLESLYAVIENALKEGNKYQTNKDSLKAIRELMHMNYMLPSMLFDIDKNTHEPIINTQLLPILSGLIEFIKKSPVPQGLSLNYSNVKFFKMYDE